MSSSDDGGRPERAAADGDEPVYRLGEVADPASVRRAPRYGRFALVGFLLGALVALALTFVPVEDPTLSRGMLFLLLLIALGSLGALGGALAAILADRRSLRRRAARAGRP